MGIFCDVDQFYDSVGALMERAKTDAKIGPKIAKSKLIIQFRYTDPDAMTTINAKSAPTQPGAYVDIIHGDTDLEPNIVMTMQADIANAFWQGKINLMKAISKKDIVVKGSLPKVLKLLPSVQPLFKVYPGLLKEKGYSDLILK